MTWSLSTLEKFAGKRWDRRPLVEAQTTLSRTIAIGICNKVLATVFLIYYVRDAPWQVADLRDNLALEQGKSTYMFRLDEVIPSFHFPKG